MEAKKEDFLSQLVSKTKEELEHLVSINDIRNKSFSGLKISNEQKTALNNFDQYRVNILNAQESEEDFHRKYKQLQVIANLCSWREFLKEDFFE